VKSFTVSLLSAIIIFLVIPRLALAEGFNYRGFKQGMTADEAEVHAKSLGGKLKRAEDGSYYNFIMTNGSSFSKDVLLLQFCQKDKYLFRVQYIVDGGFMKYMKIIENFKKNGLKIIKTYTRTYFSQAGEEHGTIDIFLNNGVDEWDIEVSLFGQENYDTTNLQVRYGFDHCQQ
jgi:hypothetical protein